VRRVLLLLLVLAALAGGCSTAATAPGPVGDRCLAEYPDLCVPDDGSDYDCSEVDGSDFSVPGDDPMGFDRDQDGVGCET
jgi:micrococcal nuclease